MQIQEHGGDIYSAQYRLDFSTNINPLGTPHSVRSAVIRAVTELSQYPDVRCRELRYALSEKMRLSADWITCSNGAAELIYAAALAVHPETALVVCPGFSEYENALRVSGCKDIRYYMCRREKDYRVQEDILDQITEDVDMMYLSNPVNPTGAMIDRDLLVRILERCTERHVIMVLDECFLELTAHPKETTMLGYLADSPCLVILRSFTKTFAMPGLRLGYCVTSNRELTKNIRGSAQPWPVSIPAQRAGEAAIQEDEYLENARALIVKEQRYIMQTFERIGITCFEPSANYVFFEGPENLFDECAKKGILIRDCSNYRGLQKGTYRVSIRTRRDNEELCGVLSGLFRRSGRYLTGV